MQTFHSCVGRVLLWTGVLLLGSTAATARAQSGNPLLDDLLKTGVPFGQQGSKTLRPPTLKDGMSAAEQRAAIEAVLAVRPGRQIDYSQFTGTNLNTPHVFIIDLPPASEPGHTIDLWFVVYDKLAKLADAKFLKSQFQLGKADQIDTLQPADLKQRNIAPLDVSGGKEYYSHGKVLIFPTDVRVQAEGTAHVVQTTTATSTTMAGLLDPRFDQDAAFPNNWRPVLRDPNTGEVLRNAKGQPQVGDPTTYNSAGGYVRVTELLDPPGALLVEYHLVYDEPEAWFNGGDFLRPKLAIKTQDDVHDFRRKLKLAQVRGPK